MAGVHEDIVVDRRILLVVQRFVDRLFRQVNHGSAKPAKHPCRQAILRLAHSPEMRGEWPGLQEAVSIKLIQPALINETHIEQSLALNDGAGPLDHGITALTGVNYPTWAC